MNEFIQNEIREIKKSFRLAMNGVVSTLQRRQGLDYKINFGVEIPRLKGIAAEHTKNEELATTLWQDNIRECRILAIYLMPEEGFCNVAEKWISESRFTEIADQLAMHLLCKMSDATNKALEWTRNSEEMFRYCGYQTISHLLRRGITLNEAQEKRLLESLANLPGNGTGVTLKCAQNALMNYLDRTPDAVERLRKTIGSWNNDAEPFITLLESFENY